MMPVGQLYAREAAGEVRQALDEIFRFADFDLKFARGTGCDFLLSRIDVNRLGEDLLVGLLSATYPGKHVIPSRVAFAQRVREKLIREIGVADATKLMDEIAPESK